MMCKENFSIRVKAEMNYEEIVEWKSGKFFESVLGPYQKDGWGVGIWKDIFDHVDIKVCGYNGIFFGEFKIDNGVIDNNTYSPKLIFYNTISFSQRFRAYVSSDTLTSLSNVKPKDGYVEFTLDTLLDVVKDSWGKIKKFLDENIE